MKEKIPATIAGLRAASPLDRPAEASMASSTVVEFRRRPAAAARSGETPIALLPKAGCGRHGVRSRADVFITAIEPPKLVGRQAAAGAAEHARRAACSPMRRTATSRSWPPRGGTGDDDDAAMPKMPVAVIDRGVLTRALDALHRSRDTACAPPTARSIRCRHLRRACCPCASTAAAALPAPERTTASHSTSARKCPAALALAVRQLGIKRIQAYGTEAIAPDRAGRSARGAGRCRRRRGRPRQHRRRRESAAGSLRAGRHDGFVHARWSDVARAHCTGVARSARMDRGRLWSSRSPA